MFMKKAKRKFEGWLRSAILGCGVLFVFGSMGEIRAETGTTSELIVSVKQQKLAVVENGQPVMTYPVSTSKFGTGDAPGSYATPLGTLKVQEKIGSGAPLGAVFKSRHPTGEVLAPNAQGRDPIVTRILWLVGMEEQNRNSFGRFIYIHGTPQEAKIGKPASYGCIRMKSADVAELFERVELKTTVRIVEGNLPSSRHPASPLSNPLLVLSSLWSGGNNAK